MPQTLILGFAYSKRLIECFLISIGWVHNVVMQTVRSKYQTSVRPRDELCERLLACWLSVLCGQNL